jgi:hypothetical protein
VTRFPPSTCLPRPWLRLTPRPFQLTIRQPIPTSFLQNNRRTRQTPTPIAEATLHRPRLP